MLKRTKRSARATPPFYDRVEVRHNPYELASYRRRALAASRNVLDAIQRLRPKKPRFSKRCSTLTGSSSGSEDMMVSGNRPRSLRTIAHVPPPARTGTMTASASNRRLITSSAARTCTVEVTA